MMYQRHVLADPAFLTDDLLADRIRLTRQPGGRFASACFVTGALDPFDDRAAWRISTLKNGFEMGVALLPLRRLRPKLVATAAVGSRGGVLPGDFTIGDLARETGCKVQTIRYYEEIGLMPEPARTAGNQRRYGQRHVDRLAFIRHSRELGFPLDAIRELFSLADHPSSPVRPRDLIARRSSRTSSVGSAGFGAEDRTRAHDRAVRRR